MKTQTAKVKAVAERLNRSAGGLVQWTVSATLQPGITNGYFKDEITADHQRHPRADDPDLGRGQRPECRLGDAVDHQFRPDSRRPVGHQDRARPFVRLHSRSPSSKADRAELRAVEQQPGSCPATPST